MPIKLADLIENLDNTYPVIDSSYGASGITSSPIKGFGIFENTSGRDNLHTQRRTDGYLSVDASGPDLYIYTESGTSWTTAADHKRVLHSGNYKDIFRISDYSALTIPAGETAGTYLTDQYTSAVLLIESNPVEEPEKITISQLFESLAVSIITENVDNGAGSFASYGGTVASGGQPGDIDGDGLVAVSDILLVLSTFNATGPAAGPGYKIVKQSLTNNPAYSLADWSPTNGAQDANVPLITNGTGVTVEANPSTSATVGVTISSNGYHTFEDGPEYEIAVGAGTIGAQKFGFQWPVMEFQDVLGSSISQLYFYLTIGRQDSSDVWTDYTGMIAAYQVGSDPGQGGFIPPNTDNYILATNMGDEPFFVINPGNTVVGSASASTLPQADMMPATEAPEYDLTLFWESLSAAAGDDYTFWIANMKRVRARFHYSHNGSNPFTIKFQYEYKFSCKP